MKDLASYEKIAAKLDLEVTEMWPEPQPLTAEVEFEPYPLDALPTLIRQAV